MIKIFAIPDTTNVATSIRNNMLNGNSVVMKSSNGSPHKIISFHFSKHPFYTQMFKRIRM